MKTTKTIESQSCDLCGNKDCVWNYCQGCGKDICGTCVDVGRAVQYQFAVYFRGSDDGVYCKECDSKTKGSHDQLHAAFMAVADLKAESIRWNDDFKRRMEMAEKHLKSIPRRERAQ